MPYSGIILNSFYNRLFPKLFQHNRRMPTYVSITWLVHLVFEVAYSPLYPPSTKFGKIILILSNKTYRRGVVLQTLAIWNLTHLCL